MEKIPGILAKQRADITHLLEQDHPELARLFDACFLNTWETTLKELEDGSVFVITGDIPAMWLRDSAAQVKPYVRWADKDEELAAVLEQILRRQTAFVLMDPYANAFNARPDGRGHRDDTDRSDPWVWERKYEVDSLCAPIYLMHEYVGVTHKKPDFWPQFRAMIRRILEVFRTEQDHERSPYYFRRADCPASDTLPCGGRGRPVNRTGMTWSGFRPSDDACEFGYLVPSNMMAVVALRQAAFLLDGGEERELSASCAALADEIDEGIRLYAVVNDPEFGPLYSYETDGFGNHRLMDDANSPSLLSIPYIGYRDGSDAVYRNTRRFILSRRNPFYYEGTFASGVGSPHTPAGRVWPIALAMQALTSDDREEVSRCLRYLEASHAGTYQMHEAFDPSRPEAYSRSWFAWANSLFSELIIRLTQEGFFAR